MRNNRSLSISLFLIVGAVLGALGFNTLDAMINTFFWRNVDASRLWYMNTYIMVEVWSAYFFFGILPLTVGSFLLGVAVRSVLVSE